jgi:hypothetical protein
MALLFSNLSFRILLKIGRGPTSQLQILGIPKSAVRMALETNVLQSFVLRDYVSIVINQLRTRERFEHLTALAMKNYVFWNMTPCRFAEI